MSYHISNTVKQLRNYYGNLYFDHDLSISEKLERLSKTLWKAYESNNDVILNEINNYHPNYIGQSWERIKANSFGFEDARTTIACQYGYKSLNQVKDLGLNVVFETAVDLLLDGSMEALKSFIISYPDLTTMASQFGHNATLLHYLGNNGVELYRQVVPGQFIDRFQLLMDAGSDIDAKMNVYDGEFTFIELFDTSIHPKDAGIHREFMAYYGGQHP